MHTHTDMHTRTHVHMHTCMHTYHLFTVPSPNKVKHQVRCLRTLTVQGLGRESG